MKYGSLVLVCSSIHIEDFSGRQLIDVLAPAFQFKDEVSRGSPKASSMAKCISASLMLQLPVLRFVVVAVPLSKLA